MITSIREVEHRLNVRCAERLIEQIWPELAGRPSTVQGSTLIGLLELFLREQNPEFQEGFMRLLSHMLPPDDVP